MSQLGNARERDWGDGQRIRREEGMGCRHQHGVVDGGDEPRSRRAWRQNDATLSGHGLESDRAARTFQAQPQCISSIQPPAANQGAGFLEWLKKYTRQTPIKNDFFQSTVRASIRNQRPRNTCKHQRNPSGFSMKPRVYKPQKKRAAIGIQMAVRLLFLFLYK